MHFLAIIFLSTALYAGDFFQIHGVKVWEDPPAEKSPVKEGVRRSGLWGVWKETVGNDPQHPERGATYYTYQFEPSVEVQVSTQLQTKSDRAKLKLCFFDKDKKLLKTCTAPAVAKRVQRADFDVPVFYGARKVESIFFVLPPEYRGKDDWSAVVLFGDSREVGARVYPSGSPMEYEFSEKELVLGLKGEKVIDRKADMDPVVEMVVQTKNKSQSQMTLFLRPPAGVKKASEIKGVLALCQLADNVDQIRQYLQRFDPASGEQGLLSFAEQNRLAILAWGSKRLWDPNASYDEQSRKANQEMDKGFDEVAEAWEDGIRKLSVKYGIPLKNYLLWGQCGSAQWAHRLALRKPNYFLAVHVHIPGSFDQPTPEAVKILWNVTTGESFHGVYERSNRFYDECRRMGYPIVYKAVIGVGHSGSPIADEIGMRFFEYALKLESKRTEYETGAGKLVNRNPLREGEMREPWLEEFRHPEYVGDYMNQEVVPYEQREIVPESFRVPLPTKAIADAWKRDTEN